MSSDEQQPTGEDEQTTAAYYERADASKFPTSGLGQRAAIEGMGATRGFVVPGKDEATRARNLRKMARMGIGRLEIDQAAADKIRAKMVELMAEYDEQRERERAQEEAAYGLKAFADRYAAAKSYEERDDLAEQAGNSMSLPEAGLVRRLAKALEGALPDVIVDAHVDGMNAREIARELACSERHAYQVIKDYPWEAAWVLYRATGDDEWERVDAGLIETSETADDLADRILGERLDEALARTGARVCVWRAGDGDDPDEARGVAEHEADTPYNH